MTTPFAVILAALVAWLHADPPAGTGAAAETAPPAVETAPQVVDAPAEGASAALPAVDATALINEYRPKLAETWLREVVLILGSPALTPENFEPALELAESATALTPDDPEAWRLTFLAAQLCAPGVPRAREIEHEAITRLVKLDPTDQVAQLLRLSLAIESYETAEERLAAYRKLLSPESKQILGAALSSRLAFQMALLQSRMGDIDGFAQSLADSVTLDPAFPAATELAAGFFAGRVDDVGDAAELLVAAIVANPPRIGTYLDLGAILLAEGAYRSAARIYRLALLVNGDSAPEVTNEIICDLAIAQWGAGDNAAALVTVRQRIQRLDDLYRQLVYRSNPEARQSELATQFAPLTSLMATLYAALARSTSAPDADAAFVRLNTNFKRLAEHQAATTTEDDTTRVGALLLENAWTTLLLGGNPGAVPEMVEAAHKVTPLDQEALDRFVGWERLRNGQFDGALEVLQPLAPNDPMARLGVGEALIARGDVRDGAREILAVANAERGTALGLFAADRIESLIGVRPTPGPAAASLDTAVAELPQGFDRFIESASSALGMTIEPEKTTYAPFERVRFRVTLSNRSQLTLAIDSQGPIRAFAGCAMSVSMVGSESGDLPTSVVPIDRRLELAPRESLSFIYDPSLTLFGALTTVRPLQGATATARCVVNFVPMEPRVTLAFMGREVVSAPVRIEGVRTDATWVERTWADLRDAERIPDPTSFVLMAHFLASQEDAKDPSKAAALAPQWLELAEIWRRFPPLVQAWMLMVLPVTAEGDKALVEVIREATDPAVVTSFLLKRVKDAKDSALDAARRSGDPRLARLADGVQRAIENRLDLRQREFGLTENP